MCVDRCRGEQEAIEVAWVSLEDRRRLRAGVGRTPGQEIYGSETVPRVQVRGIEFSCLQEKRKRQAELSRLEVSDPRTRDRVGVARLDAEHVHIFDDRLRVPLALEVTIGPGQVARLARLG
jgi:hypothetical protein